jgi:hypothetical protein
MVTFRFVTRAPAWLVLPLVAPLPLVTGCLNPNFVNTIAGGVLPTAPGDAAMVQVRIENRSSATIVRTLIDTSAVGGALTTVSFENIDPNTGEIGTVFGCPVNDIRLGTEDGTEAAFTLRERDGTVVTIAPTDPLIENVDFICGDTVIYMLYDDSSSETGYAISVGRIDGRTQTGPFQSYDTFTTLSGVLLLNGFSGFGT